MTEQNEAVASLEEKPSLAMVRVLEIRQRVKPVDLKITRVPEKALLEFKHLATEDFAGDYGMTLKHLLDFRSGILTSPNEKLQSEINLLYEEVAEIKGILSVLQAQKEEKNIRRMSNGRIVQLR